MSAPKVGDMYVRIGANDYREVDTSAILADLGVTDQHERMAANILALSAQVEAAWRALPLWVRVYVRLRIALGAPLRWWRRAQG